MSDGADPLRAAGGGPAPGATIEPTHDLEAGDDDGVSVAAFAGATVGDVIAATRGDEDENDDAVEAAAGDELDAGPEPVEEPEPLGATAEAITVVFDGDQAALPLALPVPDLEPVLEDAPAASAETPPPPSGREALPIEPEEAPDLFAQPPARRDVVALVEGGASPAALLAEVERLLERQPDDPALLAEQGTVLVTLLRFDVAEAALRRALRLAPDEPGALAGLGRLLCRRARWRDAIEPLRRATELEPSFASAHYFLGEAYNHVDQLPSALAAYEMAAALAPRHWRAHKGVGVVLDRMGRPEEAATAHRRAREAHAQVNQGAAGRAR